MAVAAVREQAREIDQLKRQVDFLRRESKEARRSWKTVTVS